MSLNMNLFAVMFISALSACTPDVNTTSAAAVQAVSAPPSGGWSVVDAMGPDVQEAARFAVQSFAVQSQRRILYKDVDQALEQLVAGVNYQLQLQVKQDGVQRIAQVKVWRKLDGRYELTEWVWQDR